MTRIVLAALSAVLVCGGVAWAQGPAPEAAARGARLYDRFCAQCHGPAMESPGTTAFDLRTFPVDQHDRFTASVNGGKNAMPAWTGVLTPAEIDDIWAYVRTRGGT